MNGALILSADLIVRGSLFVLFGSQFKPDSDGYTEQTDCHVEPAQKILWQVLYIICWAF